VLQIALDDRRIQPVQRAARVGGRPAGSHIVHDGEDEAGPERRKESPAAPGR
jgi:hypothetical protein